MPAAVSALVETGDFDEVRRRAIEIRNIHRNDVSKYAVPKHRDRTLPRSVSGFIECLYGRRRHTMELPIRGSTSENDG